MAMFQACFKLIGQIVYMCEGCFWQACGATVKITPSVRMQAWNSLKTDKPISMNHKKSCRVILIFTYMEQFQRQIFIKASIHFLPYFRLVLATHCCNVKNSNSPELRDQVIRISEDAGRAIGQPGCRTSLSSGISDVTGATSKD